MSAALGAFLPKHRLVDLPRPEEGVSADLVHGFLESHASIHEVVDLAPSVALCPE